MKHNMAKKRTIITNIHFCLFFTLILLLLGQAKLSYANGRLFPIIDSAYILEESTREEQEDARRQNMESAPLIDEGIVETGVECIIIRTASDERLSFSGPLTKGLKVGDRVRLYGQRMDFGACGQGTPVDVKKVEKIPN